MNDLQNLHDSFHQAFCSSQVNHSNSLADQARGIGHLGQVGLAQAQQAAYRTLWPRAPMTASDLGIVDQNLDDKVGMEP